MRVAPSGRAARHANEMFQDPLFRRGYDHAFRGRDLLIERYWSTQEAESYRQGYKFALWLQNEDLGRQSFTCGRMVNTELAGYFVLFANSGLDGAVA